MSKAKIAGFAMLAAALAIGALLAGHLYRQHREKAFNLQLEQASDDVSEVIDKIDSDQGVFDLADDRAVASTQKLKRMAYSDALREGATDLAVEIGHLRACRAARHLPGDQFEKCLDGVEKLNHEAFHNLPDLK